MEHEFVRWWILKK